MANCFFDELRVTALVENPSPPNKYFFMIKWQRPLSVEGGYGSGLIATKNITLNSNGMLFL
jgi:hypothetical protein